MYVLRIGIEHLFTGVELEMSSLGWFRFEQESASIVRVLSYYPFTAYWSVQNLTLTATHEDGIRTLYTAGEADYHANATAMALRNAHEAPHRMRGISVPKSRSKDWPPFTESVIRSMKIKFGKDANLWFSRLQWNGSHWYFHKDGMYHGVEPDGNIHT